MSDCLLCIFAILIVGRKQRIYLMPMDKSGVALHMAEGGGCLLHEQASRMQAIPTLPTSNLLCPKIAIEKYLFEFLGFFSPMCSFFKYRYSRERISMTDQQVGERCGACFKIHSFLLPLSSPPSLPLFKKKSIETKIP